MSLVITDFNEIGSTNNSAGGGQSYSVVSKTDTLAVMLASGYLDSVAGKLNDRDMVMLSGTDGSVMTQVTITSGVVTTTTTNYAGTAQSLSGAGAVDITSAITELTSTGVNALTLADGAIGQEKTIIMVVDAGDATLTPTNALGYSTILFADAGDSVLLKFRTGGWAIVGSGGLAGGPVAA